MNNASSIAALLAEHDLSTYAKDFEEHGWDSLTALQNISDGDLEQLIADVAMKSGHISRLRKALGKAPVARATAPPAVGPAEAQGVPDPVPGAAAAQPAAAGQPAGDATGGQPAPAPAMSADQAMLQRKLHMKLTSTNVLGQLEHGTIINTYQSGTELMIRIVSEELFYCACCAIPPRSGDNAGARRCGLSFCNVYSHMGSKEHFNSFRRRVFDMPFDATAWYEYTMSNKHGPRRALKTVQHAKRAASAELKRDSKKPRGNDTPPPDMSMPGMSATGMATPSSHMTSPQSFGVSPQPMPPFDSPAVQQPTPPPTTAATLPPLSAQPDASDAQPAAPAAEPDAPGLPKPNTPAGQPDAPDAPAAKPDASGLPKPNIPAGQPAADPDAPAAKPTAPAAKPNAPAAKSATPAAKSPTPAAKSAAPAAKSAARVRPSRRSEGQQPPPPMEVACCDADHEGAWDGDWEKCEVVADYGDTCDVRIAEDKQLCRGVPRRLVRAQAAADPPGDAQEVLGFEGILTGNAGYGQATARSY